MPKITIDYTHKQIDRLIDDLRFGKNKIEYFDASLMKGINLEHKAIQDMTGKWEIKSDFDTIRTGNICIEVESNNVPSGLCTTEADWWTHAIQTPKHTIYLTMPIAHVNKLAIKHEHMGHWVYGGQKKLAKLILVPWQDVLDG